MKRDEEMNKRELEEELKKTSAGKQFLEEAEPYEKFESAKDHICKLAGDYKCWDNRLTHDEALELCKVLEQKPCEDAISREDVIKAVDRHTFDTDDGLCLDEDISIILEELPPVKPTHKKGKWIDTTEISTNKRGHILHEVICSECNGISYFRSMGNKYIGANFCPNCDAKMESEE